jgi:hypothetical protein
MKITADQIDFKAIAGETKDGRSVVYIATKGGLHAFFCKDEEGQIMSIGAAPHRAIAKFLAAKKEKIEWSKDFEGDGLNKSEADFFQKLRKVMFMDQVQLGDKAATMSDTFLVYDVRKSEIEVVKREDLEEQIKKGTVDKYALVRDMNLSQKVQVLKEHDEFADLFGEG